MEEVSVFSGSSGAAGWVVSSVVDVWSAAGGSSFDCSGLVFGVSLCGRSWVFGSAGVWGSSWVWGVSADLEGSSADGVSLVVGSLAAGCSLTGVSPVPAGCSSLGVSPVPAGGLLSGFCWVGV